MFSKIESTAAMPTWNGNEVVVPSTSKGNLLQNAVLDKTALSTLRSNPLGVVTMKLDNEGIVTEVRRRQRNLEGNQ